jgi:hypothetical protein
VPEQPIDALSGNGFGRDAPNATAEMIELLLADDRFWHKCELSARPKLPRRPAKSNSSQSGDCTRRARARIGRSNFQAFRLKPSPAFGSLLLQFSFFASWTKGWKTWECDEFPRARTSFERALHLKTTCFASVGDILKAVDEENRHDLRY